MCYGSSAGARDETRSRGTRRHLGTALAPALALLTFATTPGLVDSQTIPDDAPPHRPLTPREVVEFQSFPVRAPIQVSPDGRRVAYTVEGPERTLGTTSELVVGGTDVWIRVRVFDGVTGETVDLTPDASSWSPAWSPDGSTLAFHSNRGGAPALWVWSPSRDARRVSDAVIWAAFLDQAPRWSPDGRKLVVKLLPEGRRLAEAVRLSIPGPPTVPVEADTTIRLFRSEAAPTIGTAFPDWIPWRYGGDLAVVDVESGVVTRLATGAMPAWWRISPDGSLLAFSDLRGMDDERAGFSLRVVPIDGGQVRELPGDVRQAFGDEISWSPTRPHLAYVSHGGVFVVDVMTDEVRRLTDSRGGWSERGGPVWTPDGRALLFTDGALWSVSLDEGDPHRLANPPDRNILRVMATTSRTVAETPAGEWLVSLGDPNTGKTGFGRFDPSIGTLTDENLEEGRFSTSAGLDLTADGGTVVSAFSATDVPPDLWLLDHDLTRRHRVSALNPAFDAVALGTTRLVEWHTGQGRRLEGSLLLPPGYREGTRLPLVVEVYGGSAGAAALHSFDRYRQLLATHGYAVLVPDIPLAVSAPMRGHADAVEPAVDRLIGLGIADPERIGVYGHSYGGYGTVALLAQTDRFGAGVAAASHGNMAGMFGRLGADGTSSTAWAVSGQGRMGGAPWEDPTTYVENSPLFFLDRVEAPLLLLHGADDRNTPAYLAGEIFTGLRFLDRTVALAIYGGEGHSWRSWRLANKIDYWERLLAWFDEHL